MPPLYLKPLSQPQLQRMPHSHTKTVPSTSALTSTFPLASATPISNFALIYVYLFPRWPEECGNAKQKGTLPSSRRNLYFALPVETQDRSPPSACVSSEEGLVFCKSREPCRQVLLMGKGSKIWNEGVNIKWLEVVNPGGEKTNDSVLAEISLRRW